MACVLDCGSSGLVVRYFCKAVERKGNCSSRRGPPRRKFEKKVVTEAGRLQE